MATQFTFVPVDVSDKKKRDQVAPEYRSIIRCVSARSPWNRALQGETIIPGLKPKPSLRRLVPRVPVHRVSTRDWRRPAPLLPSGSCAASTVKEGVDSITSPAGSPESDAHKLSELVRQPAPFWNLPIPYRNYMSRILEYRFSAVTRHIPILDDPSTQLTPSRWALSRIWAENHDSPTFLYATLLHSGAFLSAQRSANLGEIMRQEHLLWLRLSAIRAINADLRDPDILQPQKYAKFASMLVAISTLASFEFHFGDRSLQRAHHKALARCVVLYGGLEALDELQRGFYFFILKVALLDATYNSVDYGQAEFVASASALRDLLREPARALGCDDLDSVLGPPDT